MPELDEMFANNMAANGPPPGIPPEMGGAGPPSMAPNMAPPAVPSDPMPAMGGVSVIPRLGMPEQPQMAPMPPFPQRLGRDEAIIGNPASNPNDGVLKRMLMNFAYGASEAIKTKLGMPTEVELQQKKYTDDVRQWQMAAQARQQEFQNQNIIHDNKVQDINTQLAIQRMNNQAERKGNQYVKRDMYTDLVLSGVDPVDAARAVANAAIKPDTNISPTEAYIRQAGGDPSKPETLTPSVLQKAHELQSVDVEKDENRKFQHQMSLLERSAEAAAARADKQQDKLTAATRTMIEATPKVLQFSARIRPLIDQLQTQLGPAAGRWSEYMTGKVGADDPNFTRLRTNVALLQTLLMRMHVGARGGQEMMQHFKGIIDVGKQSPGNLLAALDVIDSYAKDVASEGQGGLKSAVSSAGADVPSGAQEWIRDPKTNRLRRK
jgi:hypothetical protein